MVRAQVQGYARLRVQLGTDEVANHLTVDWECIQTRVCIKENNTYQAIEDVYSLAYALERKWFGSRPHAQNWP